MTLTPKIKRKSFVIKQCVQCGQSFGSEGFAVTSSPFYPDGTIPICNNCIDRMIRPNNTYDWDKIDKLCQWADIPFIVKEWEKLDEMSGVDIFYRYAALMQNSEYETVSWGEVEQKYRELKASNSLGQELSALSAARRAELRSKWGQYDDDGYNYLERLYNGLLMTQSVNGDLQRDQAEKICKISYEVDRRIAAGEDFDKLLGSYEKLIKAAEFTPKNTKNANDFESIGEVIKYMEKRGWKNKLYDNEKRDIVDETIQSMQNFNRRLYTQEVSIGDEITRRIEALKTAAAIENEGSYYGIDEIQASDNYDAQTYKELFNDDDNEFKIEEDTSI